MSSLTTDNPTVTGFLDNITARATDESQSDLPSLLIICIILGIISVCGTVGNGLVIYVFTRKSDKVTSTIFILALAWTDLFTCSVIVPFTVVYIQRQGNLMYDAACRAYQFLITFNVPLSAFIMVAIAVDRYFSICHPFLHAVTPRRARISILCLCLLAFTLGTITALMYGVYTDIPHMETAGRGEASWCPNITQDDSLLSQTTRTILDLDVFDSAMQSGGPNAASTSRPDLTLAYSNSQAFQIVVNEESFNTTTDSIHDTATSVSLNCSRNVSQLEYNGGQCDMDGQIFSENTVDMFANIQASFYAISLLVVFSLYFLIYRSVVRRRAWRRKQKSWSHAPMTAVSAAHNASEKQTQRTSSSKSKSNNSGENEKQQENMELIRKNQNGNDVDNNENGDSNPNTKNENGTPLKQQVTVENGNSQPTSKVLSSAEKKASRERRDFNFLANIRTAVMLFVVAIVFIFSFLPAWLMASGLIPFNVIVFYMYFSYNTANPVIYAFMNQSFRKELKRVFQRDFPWSKVCCRPKPRISRDLEESKTIHTIYSACESPVNPLGGGAHAQHHNEIQEDDVGGGAVTEESVDDEETSSVVEAAIAASSQANV